MQYDRQQDRSATRTNRGSAITNPANDDQPQPTVIFDFDGTLVDTFIMSIRIFEKLTKRTEPLSDDRVQHLRGLTVFQLARELRIRPWRVPWLLVRWRAMMYRRMNSVEVFDGMEPVLQQLRAAGVPMYIISTNSPGNIRKLLRRRGLNQYFVQVHGNVAVFGKAKLLRRIIAYNKLRADDAYYVGDEARDVDAAKRAGAKSVAVTWGYSSAEVLQRRRPFALVRTPEELGRLFDRLSNT